MSQVEYKVIPAPRKPRSMKGAKTKADALARAMEEIIAEEVKQGWEYQRCDLIVCEERSSLFSKKTEQHRAMLVFRRGMAAQPVAVPATYYQQQPYPQPMPQAPRPMPQGPDDQQPFRLAEEQQRSPLPFRPVGSAND